MRKPKPLGFHPFGTGEHIAKVVADSTQVAYLRCYLGDLGARSIVEEPYYFDRDYLAEFAAFYSSSSRGYVNVCRRLHFFGADVGREQLLAAASGDETAHEAMQKAYLGLLCCPAVGAPPVGPDRADLVPRHPA